MPLSRGFAAEAYEVGVSILYQAGTFAPGPPIFSDGVMLARRRARGCLDAAERSRRRRGGVASAERSRRRRGGVASAERSRRRRGGVASAERSRRRRGGVALTPRRFRADAAEVHSEGSRLSLSRAAAIVALQI